MSKKLTFKGQCIPKYILQEGHGKGLDVCIIPQSFSWETM